MRFVLFYMHGHKNMKANDCIKLVKLLKPTALTTIRNISRTISQYHGF
uniref:Bm14490 n=1 Tax=Brugia malayi TaxID=6279 RepID=A0A1I9G611_BRUMA|nr:Bm14490 [Brugia malayi]